MIVRTLLTSALMLTSVWAIAQHDAVLFDGLAETKESYPETGYEVIILGGDRILVERDLFGVPRISAPNADAAFRAQGYVIAEDRLEQMRENRRAAWGLRASEQGQSALPLDRRVRRSLPSTYSMQQQVDRLPDHHRARLEAYVAGVNDYLAAHAPDVTPWTTIDCVAQSIYMVSIFGDGGEDEYSIYTALESLVAFKGRDYVTRMLDDGIPVNVPAAPTTDHSADNLVDLAPIGAFKRVGESPATYQPHPALLGTLADNMNAYNYAEANGLFTHWGSKAWVVGPELSASGEAMIFGGPMMGWANPPVGAEVALHAPGIDAQGLCLPGLPGLVIGHNKRIAWTNTSGTQNQTDYYILDLDPVDHKRYRHGNHWHPLETIDSPIPTNDNRGGSYDSPFTQYWSHYGPVIAIDEDAHIAYAQATAHAGHELDSWMAFSDLAFAQDFDEFESSVRDIHSSHNFFAADVDGNIGYWLAGRLPITMPHVDPRMPRPATGDADWQGLIVATDLARSINPPEGWFANWNNKPSIHIPSWMPELFWGAILISTLENAHDMTFDDVLDLNRESGEHNFIAHYMKPYLIQTLRMHGKEDPRYFEAAEILEQWPDKNLPGSAGALIMNEWFQELMIETLSPTYQHIIIRRSLDFQNLRLFGALTYRALFPERSAITLSNDYLMGRTTDEIALTAFDKTLIRMTKLHGPSLRTWKYDPGYLDLPNVPPVATRRAGTYSFGAHLTSPIQAVTMLPPGQHQGSASPHYDDQLPYFRAWQYKPFTPVPRPEPVQ